MLSYTRLSHSVSEHRSERAHYYGIESVLYIDLYNALITTVSSMPSLGVYRTAFWNTVNYTFIAGVKKPPGVLAALQAFMAGVKKPAPKKAG